MRQRSETWAKLAARGRFTLDVVAVIGGVTYTAISAPVIDRALVSDAMSVGNCISASMDVSVLTDDDIASAAPVIIRARLLDGDAASEWLEFGTFYIAQRESDPNTGLLSLRCYDAMLKASQRYVDPSIPDDRIGWPKSMQTCVNEVAQRIGVEIDSRTVINTADAYQVAYPTNYTMQEVLGWIGAAHGGNWIITPENKLRLVPLISPPAETFDIVDYYYNKIYTDDGYKLVWKHRETEETLEHGAGGGTINVPVVIGKITTGKSMTISRVTIARDDTLGYTLGDDTGVELRSSNNPYANQAVCDDLYADLNGVVYAPFAITNACYDPCTELGDWILVGEQVRSVIYKQTLTFGTDFRVDASAPGKDETSSEYPYLTEIEKLQLEDESLKNYSEETKVYLETKIEQTYEDITLEVDKLTEADEITRTAVSQLALAVEGISLSAVSENGGSYLRLTNGENSSEVALSMSVTNGGTESTLVMKAGDVLLASEKINFSGFATFSGLADGTTTIDGGCIKTGTIDASRINLNIDTSSLASKEYVTSKIEALEDGLSLSASNGSETSTIYLRSGGATIDSATITFNGMVTFNDLKTSGSTVINGSNITTGTLNANYLTLSNSYGGFKCASGYDGLSTTYGAMMYGSNSRCYFIATSSGVRMQAYGTSFYCSANHIVASQAITQNSSQSLASSISYDMSSYEQFFLNLTPCCYTLADDTSGTLHCGFFAQDVETAITTGGLSTQKFGGYLTYEYASEASVSTQSVGSNQEAITQTETAYALSYNEFIALNTYMIQKLYTRIAELEEVVKNLGGNT